MDWIDAQDLATTRPRKILEIDVDPKCKLIEQQRQVLNMDRNFLEQLEASDNEAEVRERLAAGLYNVRHAAIAKEFLRRKEEKRAAETSARSEARDEENLKIARESVAISRKALDNSRSATRIAVIAVVLSVVLAIQKLIEWYSK